jgi:hypothetical protein
MRRLSAILASALACVPLATWAQASLAQEASAPAFCPDLKRVATLAMSQEKFASITGKPRQGNFSDVTLTLAGWQDCALYGTTTYTCDSLPLDSAQAAEQAQADIMQRAKACLGEGWSESTDRGSANYVVLHSALRPVSITLSTDQTDDKHHVVRLIMFVRRN